MGPYEVSMEIAGPAAMWARPDTGAAPVSYPAPTFSAAKGIFESIARMKSAWIRPIEVEICAPIRYHRYFTNYGGPLRKDDQIRKKASYQLLATILADVCYRFHGIVEERTPSPGRWNHLHGLQAMFERRLANGQYWQTPCLGWSEFLPRYVGPIRPDDEEAGRVVRTDIDLVIPSMLHSLWDRPGGENYAEAYHQDVRIERGVLVYPLREAYHAV